MEHNAKEKFKFSMRQMQSLVGTRGTEESEKQVKTVVSETTTGWTAKAGKLRRKC